MIQGSWAPIPDITFRTAFNKASQAPLATQISREAEFSRIAGFVDPCGPNPAPGATRPLFTIEDCRLTTNWQDSFYNNAALTCPEIGCLIRTGDYSDLGPVEAKTTTYGVVLQPRFLPGLMISADRWTIRYTNRIVYSGVNLGEGTGSCEFASTRRTTDRLRACAQFVRDPATGALFSSTPNPTAGYIGDDQYNDPLTNQGRGYDFQLRYERPVAALRGRLNIDMNGTLTTDAGGGTGGQFNKAGYFGVFVNDPVPKWRHTLRGTYTADENAFLASVNWRHISGTRSGLSQDPILLGISCAEANYTPAQCPQTLYSRIKPYDYMDLSLSTTVSKRLTLTLNINNVFDRDPPIIPAVGGLGTYSVSGNYTNAVTNFYDPFGRFIQLSAAVKF